MTCEYLCKFPWVVHEVAALSELALVFFIENLAFSGAVEFTGAPSVPCSELFYSMSKSASVFIGAISFFHKVFAEFYFDLVLAWLGGLKVLGGRAGVAFAGIE